MKDKKGFLLAEETLKIVIALIALGILFYFLASLYFAHNLNKDLELAEASLKYLVKKLNEEVESAEIYNPKAFKKWYIVSWPYGDKIPRSCSNFGWENCICICKNGGAKLAGLSVGIPQEKMAKDCDSAGVCSEMNKRTLVKGVLDKQSPMNIVNPPLQLNINYLSNEIIITRK